MTPWKQEKSRNQGIPGGFGKAREIGTLVSHAGRRIRPRCTKVHGRDGCGVGPFGRITDDS